MAVPDVRVRLSPEGVQEVLQAFKAVTDASNASGKKVSGPLASIKGAISGITGVLGPLGIAVGAASLVGFAKDAAAAADNLVDLKQKLGASTVNLTALGYAGSQAGADMGLIETSLLRMNKALDAARENEPGAVGMLKRLGLSAKDFDGKDAVESLEIVAKAMESRLPDGAEKSTLAMDLLGKSGADLIPLMKDLAANGLGGVIKAAAEAGVLIDEGMLKSVKAMNDGFGSLGQTATFLGIQFDAKLAPTLTRFAKDVGNILKGNSANFKAWGTIVGVVLQAVSELALQAADIVMSTVGAAGTVVVRVTSALMALMEGDVAGAKEEIRGLGEELKTQWNQALKRGKDRFTPWDQPVDETSPDEAAARQAKLEADRRQRLEAAAKAEATTAKSLADNRLALEKATAKALAEENKRQFDEGLISVQEYYRRRREAIDKGLASELQANRAARSAAIATIDDPAKQRSELDRLARQADQLRTGAEADKKAAGADELKTFEDLSARRIDLERQVAALRGQSADESLQNTIDISGALDEILRKLGVADEERSRVVSGAIDTLTDKGNFDDAVKSFQEALNQIDSGRADIQARADAGFQTQISAELEIARLEKDRLPTLSALADAALKAATQLGDPAAIESAKSFQRIVVGITGHIENVNLTMQQLGVQLADIAQNALNDFLTQGIDNVHGFTDAVSQMARSVLQDLRRIAAEQLVLSIFGGIKGVFGSPEKKARGGRLVGPGTPTSDSIPLWGSRDEFMVRASSVLQPGALDFLYDFNERGMAALSEASRTRIRPATPSAVQGDLRLAQGGLVTPSAASSSQGARWEGVLHVRADPGYVLEVIRSAEGLEVHTENNVKTRRTLRKLVG